jgi:hypothetical protein
MRGRAKYICPGLIMFFLLSAPICLGQGQQSSDATAGTAPQAGAGGENATDLAKKTQNPVGDIVSLPFQFNFNNGGDLSDDTFFNVNFHPVFPIHISKGWTLISRSIIPIDSFPGPNQTRYSGLGDIQQQTFLTSAQPGKIIWGIGPTFSFPTATAFPAKTGTWAAGGDFVALAMPGPFVIGVLVQQLSPLIDANGPPRTNLFLLQYFVNYNFGGGWAMATAPSLTANWDASRDQRWTVPVGIGISRTFVFNRQPMSLGVQYYRNIEYPAGQSANNLRFSWSLIFPSPAHR